MNLPGRFKHWLSYLMEVPVAEYSTEYNRQLQVLLHHGRYKLTTHGAIYSYGDLYSNYRMCFEKLDWDAHPVKSCLILGLGMASIPYMLKTRFNKEILYTAVEIDEVVTKLAYDYVLNPNHIKVQIFTADAASFLQWHHGRYDLICSDVFVGDRIPAELETIEAVSAMHDLLAPGGVLLYNRLSRYTPDTVKNLKFLDDVFRKVFPEGGYLDLDGNWMFVNTLNAFR